VHGTNSV